MTPTKEDLQRRVLLAKYPRRAEAVLADAPDHNPLVLEDCQSCAGRGQRCLEADGVAAFSDCPDCNTSGVTHRLVPYFTNDAAPLSATLDAESWTTCPHCAHRFSTNDSNAWTGLRHVRCGQKLILSG